LFSVTLCNGRTYFFIEYKVEKGVGKVCSKQLSKHFATRIQRPPIQEGRRGEKKRRRRRIIIIMLKITLEGFLWEALGKIHTTTIHHPQQ
jgi:hypothetical protein